MEYQKIKIEFAFKLIKTFLIHKIKAFFLVISNFSGLLKNKYPILSQHKKFN